METGTAAIIPSRQTVVGACALCSAAFQLAFGQIGLVIFGTWPLYMVLQCPTCDEECDYSVAVQEDRDDEDYSCEVCDAQNEQAVEGQDDADANDGEDDGDTGDADE